MAILHFYTQASTEHSINANAATTRKQANASLIVPFVDDLESHGVTVTHSAEYRAIVDYRPEPYSAPDPFTTDPAVAHENITEHSLRAGDTGRSMSSAWGAYVVNTSRAMLASMASEADSYITTMRPAFNTAAATIAAALALDLDENTTTAALVDNGTPEQIQAWRDAADAAKILDRIATTRIAMSAWLDLPPQGNAGARTEVPDYTPAFMSADEPMAPVRQQLSSNAVEHRWLNLQNREGTALKLNTITELNAVGYQLHSTIG
ncbi:hypothetical protein ACTXPS_19905 [Brachybacterium tyrofermentans]|uniref:hypothetical protein n=1 Tax=Brachybacterium tyrofermentans TaxID=47848 RepID=UPI003FD3AB8F